MFFVIPFLIAFILLCILVNVDFTGEAYSHLKMYNQEEEFDNVEQTTSHNPHDFLESTTQVENESRQTMAETTTSQTFNDFISTQYKVLLTESATTSKRFKGNEEINDESNESMQVKQQKPTEMINNEPLASSKAKCLPTASNCSLYCSNGSVNFIDEDLYDLGYDCPNTALSLLVQNCQFTYGKLETSFFSGDFTLKYLAISDSDLQTIESKVFQHYNVRNLQTLILRNNLITTLTATTFEGASSLKYFEFVQKPLQNTFTAEKFLQPMANNLNEALITQAMDTDLVLDPRSWLQGSELSSLVNLDMANNNFRDILDATTFRTLIAVENLNLSNCSLWTIPAKTFDIIMGTLKYLDLHGNYLQTLDLQLLTGVVAHQIQLDLSGNTWFCDCAKQDMIEFLRDNTLLIEEVVCYAPEKYQNVGLKEVLSDCEDSTITSITTPRDTTAEIKDNSTISTLNTDSTTISSTMETDDDASSTASPTELPTTTTSTESTTGNSSTVLVSNTTEVAETTPIPSNYISVVCYDVNRTETIFWFQRNDFFIYTTSATSVTIQIPRTFKQQPVNIIYFTNYNDYKNLTEHVYSVANNTIVSIKGLTSLVTYIFCLAPTNQSTISPFDCRAHFVAYFRMSWLLSEDESWFITVTVISSLLFMAASILVVYVILRKHPIWLLNRNERILRVNNSNQKVILISHKGTTRKETDRSSSYLTAQQFIKHDSVDNDDICLYSTQHTIPSSRPPRIPQTQTDNRKSSCPSYETSQNCSLASKYLSVHFNRFHNTHTDASTLYTSQHTVPDERAPYVPKQKVYDRNSTTFLYTDFQHITSASEVNFNRFQPLDDDPDYQAIDHYEVVDF